MTHWKKMIESKYLSAFDLNEKDLNIQITSIKKEEVKTDKTSDCRVAQVFGLKPFIVNATNCKMLTKLFGSGDTDAWLNKAFTVYPTTVRVAGENVDCIRIRATLPEHPKKQELTPDHPKWTGAKEAILKGTASILDIEKKYIISPENKILLC